MRRFGNQLPAGAKQTDIDFRYCGAYRGVAYRMIAFRQGGDIGEWGTTKWPKELDEITNLLWY